MSKRIIVIKESSKMAETRARARDVAKMIDLQAVAAEDKKAGELGYGIYKLKKTNSAPFVQSNTANLRELLAARYLTNPEWDVSSKIQLFCELNTNAIIDPETKEYMSISRIAELLGRDRPTTSKIINDLLKKGVIYEIANIQEIREHNRPVTERPLFMNPELYYAGNRNEINAILSRLCITSDILEKKGVTLPWKVWYESGAKFGKLITRRTYLAKVKEAREAKQSVKSTSAKIQLLSQEFSLPK